MEYPRERFFWLIAVSLSIVAHIAIALLISGFATKADVRPIMNVRLVMREKKTAPTSAQLKQNQPAEKNKVQPKEVVPPKKPQVHPKPVKDNVLTTEKAVLPEAQTQGETNTTEAENSGNQNRPTESGNVMSDGEASSQTGKVVELDTIEVLKKVMPNYSTFSRKRREEGTVKIIATVTDGRVVSAEIESSSSYPRLDESALRAVSQWTFKNRGTVRVRVPINFKLN